MKKMIVAATVALGMSGAFAAQTNTGCQGNCPSTGGDTTVNNQGGTANGYGGSGGIGIGLGGAGGNGGSGIGVGGTGGSVVGSGNSSASGGHGGSVLGSGNSAATGGSVKNSGNSKNTNRNDNNSNATSYGSVATTAQSSSVNVGGDTYQAPRIPVASAWAAPLTASNGTCMGSSSMGAQGVGFGVSIGSTWNDAGCDRRYNAQALAAVGMRQAAVALLCQDPNIKAAMETAGTPCAGSQSAAVSDVDVRPMIVKTMYQGG